MADLTLTRKSEKGNTKPSQCRSRDWVFTANGETRGVVKWDEEAMSYLVIGQEVGESGNEHEQGYVTFKNARTLSSMIKKFPGVHFEKKRGTRVEASEYCKKDGDFEEWGEPPKGQGARSDQKRLGDLVKAGLTDKEIIEYVDETVPEEGKLPPDYAGMWIRNYKGVREARKTIFGERKRMWEMDIRIYWGNPGAGKTRAVYDEFGVDDVYAKAPGKWWTGYNGERVVLIDDFDPDDCFNIVYSYYLKLLDRYPMLVEPKGDMVQFTSQIIIFTSNYDPAGWFMMKRNRNAFIRRVKEVRHFEGGLPMNDPDYDMMQELWDGKPWVTQGLAMQFPGGKCKGLPDWAYTKSGKQPLE